MMLSWVCRLVLPLAAANWPINKWLHKLAHRVVSLKGYYRHLAITRTLRQSVNYITNQQSISLDINDFTSMTNK